MAAEFVRICDKRHGSKSSACRPLNQAALLVALFQASIFNASVWRYRNEGRRCAAARNLKIG